MSGKVVAVIAGGAVVAATAAGALPGSDSLEAVGRWPLVVVLGAVCCFCVWIIYLQAVSYTHLTLPTNREV